MPFTGSRYSFVFFSIRKCDQAPDYVTKRLLDCGFPRTAYNTPFFAHDKLDNDDLDSDDEKDIVGDAKRARDRAAERVKQPCVELEIDRVETAFDEWVDKTKPDGKPGLEKILKN